MGTTEECNDMSDINELRSDANTARFGHMPLEISGSDILEILDRLAAAEKAWEISDQTVYDLTEKVIPNIQERLEAAEKERDKYKTAYNEWCEKSEWIQEGINNREISPKYLGWHLADIALDLFKEHKEKCDDLQAKIEQVGRQEPVATIAGVDEYGPMLTWNKHWLDLAVGAGLYTLPGTQGE